MSIYQGFNTKNTSNIFNSNDIVSFEEQSSGGTTVSLDLSSFVQKNAPVFDNQLYLSDGVGLNFNGKIQNTGFTDAKSNDLEQTKNKTTNVSFSNDVTTITNTLDLQTSTVQFTDESIPQSKITNLVSRLTEIDANLASINSNDVDIQNLNNLTASHSTDISAIQSLDAVQNGRLDVNEVEIENIKLNIVEVEGNVAQNLTNNTNNLTSINNLNTLTTTHTNDIINLQTVDTNLANDIATNLATYTAYATSNDAKNVEQDGRLSSVETLNTTQDNRLDGIDTLNVAQNDRLDAVEILNSAQDGRLDGIDALNVAQNDRLTAIETTNTSQDSNIASLTAISSSNNSAITAIQSHNLVIDASVNSLEAEILTKHPTINSGNKLLASLIGNGDVNNAKLSSLNNIRTDVSIQNQINTLETNLATLDGLQDLDLVNIPTLQSDVSTLQSTVANNKTASDANEAYNLASINSNTSAIATNTTNIASNLASINSNTTAITNNANSISTINTNITALVNADTVHSSQITDLQNADTVLQSNIDLKQNIIDLTNKLDSTKVFDTALNDSLDSILSTIDSNISILNSSKQDNITTLNKLNSSLLNRNDNLQYVDVTSSIQNQINTINSNITLLQGADTTIIDDIQANFDTHDASITANTNAISTLQGLQNGDVISFQNINNSITNLTNTKHPLIDNSNKLNSSLINRDDNLQHVDISSSLQTKLNSLDTDVATKQNIIDNSNKLNSSFIDLSTTNLQYADYPSSINTKFTALDSLISTLNATDVTQATTNTNLQNSINTNASDITTANTNIATNASDIVTANSNIATNVTNIASNTADIVTANTNIATNSADIVTANNNITTANTNITTANTNIATNASDIVTANTNIATNTADIVTANNNIATNVTNIATNTADIVTANNNITTANTNIATNASDIVTANTNIATNASDIVTANNNITTANTNIATNASAITALQNADPLSSKIEPINNSLNYTTPSNILTHTYNEENIFLNTLDDNNVIELDLTITSPTNYKSYIQKVIIDCLEFKGYIHTLKINGSVVEIKHKNGDSNINLAPIAGYSTLVQTFNLTRMNDTWYAMSDIRLFYNSASNVTYDVTLPIISIIGSANINHEINMTYNDAGSSAIDNIDGDLTGNIVTVNNVNTAELGSYTVTYNVTDNAGNSAIEVIRVVNIVDTTNPVVTLNGDAEINVIIGNSYTELGSTATDNSLESLSVVITGTVDTNTLGDYNLTYTATDSTGNSHAIGRLIHVITQPLTLQYSNPTTNLFTLVDLYNNIPNYGIEHSKSYTEVGNPNSYLNGEYIVGCVGVVGGIVAYEPKNLFTSNNSLAYGTPHYANGTTLNLPNYGMTSGPFDRKQYGGTNNNYRGNTSSNGTFVYYSQLATNSNTYDGEYVEVTFPYLVEPNSCYVDCNISAYMIKKLAVLGSADDGVTYDYVGGYDIQGGGTETEHTFAISTSNKYQKFKFVFQHSNSGDNIAIYQLKLYGDIYT